MAAFFFQVTVARRIGEGPLNKMLFASARKPCNQYWWSFFLYIQNYVNPDDLVSQRHPEFKICKVTIMVLVHGSHLVSFGRHAALRSFASFTFTYKSIWAKGDLHSNSNSCNCIYNSQDFSKLLFLVSVVGSFLLNILYI